MTNSLQAEEGRDIVSIRLCRKRMRSRTPCGTKGRDTFSMRFGSHCYHVPSVGGRSRHGQHGVLSDEFTHFFSDEGRYKSEFGTVRSILCSSAEPRRTSQRIMYNKNCCGFVQVSSEGSGTNLSLRTLLVYEQRKLQVTSQVKEQVCTAQVKVESRTRICC
jgi:hypothetical protein